METFCTESKEARKIIVTGGSGFLGQQLLEVCSEEGHRVVNIDLSQPRKSLHLNPPYLRADLSDPASTRQAFLQAKEYLGGKIDDVFHMAAVVSYTLSYKSLEGPNVSAAYNVAKECVNNNAFLIHMSGTAVLGHIHRAMLETDQQSPVEDYGRSKADAENKIYSLVSSEGLKSLIFRSTAPIGSGLETAGINNLYNMILQQPIIPATAGSMVTYVNTEDIARAFLFAAENRQKVGNGFDSLDKIVYNLGVHKPLSDKEMAEHLVSSIIGEGKKRVMEIPHHVVYGFSCLNRAGNILANVGRLMMGKRRQEPDICPSLAKLMKGPHFQDYAKFERHFENNGFKFKYPTPEEVLDTGVVYKFKTEWSHLNPPERIERLMGNQFE